MCLGALLVFVDYIYTHHGYVCSDEKGMESTVGNRTRYQVTN
jgi:hypothetical protein